MKTFLTPPRILLIMLGVILCAALSYVGIVLEDTSNIFSSLAINVAASALTIAFTAALVDYLMTSERKVKHKDSFELARSNVDSVLFTVTLYLAELADIEYKPMELLQAFENESYSTKFEKKYGKQLDDAAFLSDDKDHTGYVDKAKNAFQNSVSVIDETIGLYSNALEPELTGKILRLRNALTDYINFLKVMNDYLPENKPYEEETLLALRILLGIIRECRRELITRIG